MEGPTKGETPRGRHVPGRRQREASVGKRTWDMATEVRTRRRAQRLAEEDGGWQVWETYR